VPESGISKMMAASSATGTDWVQPRAKRSADDTQRMDIGTSEETTG
jgi:hypothetical protein